MQAHLQRIKLYDFGEVSHGTPQVGRDCRYESSNGFRAQGVKYAFETLQGGGSITEDIQHLTKRAQPTNSKLYFTSLRICNV